MNILLTIFICLFLLTSCSNSSTPSAPIITPNPSPAKLKPYPCKTNINYNCDKHA